MSDPTTITPARKARMLSSMSFAKYIMARHLTNTTVAVTVHNFGDWQTRKMWRDDFIKFVRPLIKDHKFPTIRKGVELESFLGGLRELRELRELRGQGAAQAVVLGSRELWKEYKRARNRKLNQLLGTKDPTRNMAGIKQLNEWWEAQTEEIEKTITAKENHSE